MAADRCGASSNGVCAPFQEAYPDFVAPDAGTCLRPRYEKPGTDLAYGPTGVADWEPKEPRSVNYGSTRISMVILVLRRGYDATSSGGVVTVLCRSGYRAVPGTEEQLLASCDNPMSFRAFCNECR
eukprot:2136778-Rhodomonas_salina.2